MAGFDPGAFGERLRQEMEAVGWGVSDLQERLEDAVGSEGRKGTSYGSVWSYVKGQAPAEPRREVVEALADLFGVRPDYLLFDGPRTEVEAAAQAAMQESLGSRLYGVFAQEIPHFDQMNPAVHGALANYTLRWAHVLGKDPIPEDEIEEHIRHLWNWINWPFRDWVKRAGRDDDAPSLSVHQLGDYVPAVLHALSLSMQVVSQLRQSDKHQEEES